MRVAGKTERGTQYSAAFSSPPLPAQVEALLALADAAASRLEPVKSPGHICFSGTFEFYEDDAGDVYRASVDSAFDCLTGYRIGRWECSRAHFDRFRAVIA